jgi:hypothetical protein
MTSTISEFVNDLDQAMTWRTVIDQQSKDIAPLCVMLARSSAAAFETHTLGFLHQLDAKQQEILMATWKIISAHKLQIHTLDGVNDVGCHLEAAGLGAEAFKW